MNPNFDAIMSLLGVDSIKALVKKWDVLSENLRGSSTNPALILPDLLWVMNSGVGRTNLLRLLAEYLHSKGNLVDFYGNVKYFEFLLNYARPSEPFGELQRLVDEAHNAAGFRSTFRGIVCVDISEWLERYKEKHFVSFLELLSSHREDWLIILSIPEGKEEKIASLYSFLSLYLRLERVDVKLPDSDALLEYVCRKLSLHGLQLEEKSSTQLRATIEQLRSNRSFEGFKSLDMLCQDIVYEHFCLPGAAPGPLPDTVVAKFSADSPYTAKLIHKLEKVHRIGFGTEDTYGV